MARYYNIDEALDFIDVHKKWEQLSEDERINCMSCFSAMLTCVNNRGEPVIATLPEDKVISLFREETKNVCNPWSMYARSNKGKKAFVEEIIGTTPDGIPFTNHFSPKVQEVLQSCVNEVRKKIPVSIMMKYIQKIRFY